ncbi:hypothetical protein D3C71_2247610 [compost metagenome]
MDSGNFQEVIAVIIQHGKETEVPHHFGGQELADKALVLELLHGKMQRIQPV